MPPRKRRSTAAPDNRRLVFERRDSSEGKSRSQNYVSSKGPPVFSSAPPALGELAVHKKKVDQVRQWLLDALGTSPVARYRRLLALTGPAGSGKTATVHALAAASELNYDITEWHAEAAFSDSGDRISHAQRFEQFLRRVTRFSALPFAGGMNTGRRVILIEDLPNISHAETRGLVARALERHVMQHSCASHVAVVLVISDAVPPVDMVDSWWQRRDAALDVRAAVPLSVRQHPAFAEIRFNPATPRMISGALARIAGGRVPIAVLNAIAESANGDIRGASNALAVGSHDSPQARELALALFHALGRILYNKRHGDPDDDSDAPPSSEIPSPPWLPNPRRSRVDIEHLWASLPVDTDTLSLYLHHNYVPFTESVDECTGILEALSATDTLHGDASTNLTRSMYSYHIATRGILMSLPSPVPRRSQRMTKPAAYEISARLRSHQEELARRAQSTIGAVSHVPLAEYASTIAPLVSRMRGNTQAWNDRPNMDGASDDDELDYDDTLREPVSSIAPEDMSATAVDAVPLDPPAPDILDELEDLDM